MLGQNDLEQLAKRPPQADHLLTVYLDVDQSNAVNLNRGFERSLRNALKACKDKIEDPKRIGKFEADCEPIEEWLRTYEIGETGLFILSGSSEDVFDVHRLDFPVKTEAHFGPLPYIRPLVEALDEYERYAVVRCSREEAEVFLVELGRGKSRAETEASADVHKFDASGQDKMWSQMHFQRKQEMHMTQHMKALAAELETIAKKTPFDRLLLAGPGETVTQLKSVLSSTFEGMSIDTMALPANADEASIEAATHEYAQSWERNEERGLVEQVITEAAKGQRAVTALDDTFNACLDGRVRRLLYAEGFQVPDAEREALRKRIETYGGEAGSSAANGCVGDDPVEWMIRAVLRTGGEVEQVRGEVAAEFQENASGIGALLRY